MHHSKIDLSRSGLGHSRPMHSVRVPVNVRCCSNSAIIIRRSAVTLRAMCGRLRVGKENLHVAGLGRCSHVFGLLMRFA